jgi:outer membrane protein TolC
MAELKKLLGLKLKDTITVDERLNYTLIDIKEEEFLKEAYLNQPEMMLKALGIDISKWSIEMAKAGWRPQVNAFGTYLYASNDVGDMINPRHRNWQTGVSVNMPIFDAWSSRAKVDEAKAKYRQAILEKGNVSDQIAVDIRRACLDLKQSSAIIDSQKDNIAEAKEALRIAIVSYDNGVGTNLDVLDSQTSLAQAEQTYCQGMYDYLMAEAYLDRTRGKSYLWHLAQSEGPVQLSVQEAKDEKKN